MLDISTIRSWCRLTILTILVQVASVLSSLSSSVQAQPQLPQPRALPTQSAASLADAFAALIEFAVPATYEKRKDWGKTKNITIGLRSEGGKISRRKKPVRHGVWKHYKIRLVEPEQTFHVRIEKLRAVAPGRIAFTLTLSGELDMWARAKIYQYGIHLIAFEILGDSALHLALDCEVGLRLESTEGKRGVTIDPRVVDSRLSFTDFHLRRISNADGPVVRELGDGLRKLLEHELKGRKLTSKLNRAIDKKRDELSYNFEGLLESPWWPLANLPVVQEQSSAWK